jgi:hypothetical protein
MPLKSIEVHMYSNKYSLHWKALIFLTHWYLQVFSFLGVDISQTPVILNLIHGIAVEYTDDDEINDIFSWIRTAKHGRVKHVSKDLLQNVIKRENLLLILFFSQRQEPLASKLKVIKHYCFSRFSGFPVFRFSGFHVCLSSHFLYILDNILNGKPDFFSSVFQKTTLRFYWTKSEKLSPFPVDFKLEYLE